MKKIYSQQVLLKESVKELFEEQSVSRSENSSEVIKEIDIVGGFKRLMGVPDSERDKRDIESGDKEKIRPILDRVVKNTPFDLTEALQGLDEKNQKIIINAFDQLLVSQKLDSDIGDAFYTSIGGKITTGDAFKDKLIDLSIQATVAKDNIDINQLIQGLFNQAYLPKGAAHLLNNFDRVKTSIVEFVKTLIDKLKQLNLGSQLKFNLFSSEVNKAREQQSNSPTAPPFYYLVKFKFDPESLVAVEKRSQEDTKKLTNKLLNSFGKYGEDAQRKNFMGILKNVYDNPIEQTKLLSLSTDELMKKLDEYSVKAKSMKSIQESINPTRWQRLANIIKD